jgi:hypothetical protein
MGMSATARVVPARKWVDQTQAQQGALRRTEQLSPTSTLLTLMHAMLTGAEAVAEKTILGSESGKESDGGEGPWVGEGEEAS